MSHDQDHALEQDDELALQERRLEERRPVEEAGGGVSEGFELAEESLVAHAEDSDMGSTAHILQDAGDLSEEQTQAEYGEADAEQQRDD